MTNESVADTGRRTDLIVKAAFARLDIVALAVAAGVIGALLLFLATVSLLVRGAPPGVHVGPHLGLLAQFLPGYSVSWLGGLAAIFYGFLIGLCSGGAVGVFWNLIHYIYLLALGGRDHLGATEL